MRRKLLQAKTLVNDSVNRVLTAHRSKNILSTSSDKDASRSTRTSRLMNSPMMLFAREIVQNPRAMGAACPSSRHLAQNMAKQVPILESGYVLELGGGTGTITQALLQHIPANRLIVVERASNLASYLRQRFPNSHVLEGDAAQVVKLLGDKAHQVQTIVSGLPFRSLPHSVVQQIIRQVEILLQDGGTFTQFTYDLRGKTEHLPSNFRRVSTKFVWNNFPPARIDVYRVEHAK
jgi:phospholipid N-methyltransferase